MSYGYAALIYDKPAEMPPSSLPLVNIPKTLLSLLVQTKKEIVNVQLAAIGKAVNGIWSAITSLADEISSSPLLNPAYSPERLH